MMEYTLEILNKIFQGYHFYLLHTHDGLVISLIEYSEDGMRVIPTLSEKDAIYRYELFVHESPYGLKAIEPKMVMDMKVNSVDYVLHQQSNKTEWEDEDVVFLQKHYGRLEPFFVCAALRRKLVDVIAKAESMGIQRSYNVGTAKRSKKRWSTAENELLKILYPDTPNAELKTNFPGRTLSSIQNRAKTLGLAKSESHIAGGAGSKLGDDFDLDAFSADYQTMTVRALAAKYNISKPTVISLSKKYNLKKQTAA